MTPKEEFIRRAATEALPVCIKIVADLCANGGQLIEDNAADQAADMACQYAVALERRIGNYLTHS